MRYAMFLIETLESIRFVLIFNLEEIIKKWEFLSDEPIVGYLNKLCMC